MGVDYSVFSGFGVFFEYPENKEEITEHQDFTDWEDWCSELIEAYSDLSAKWIGSSYNGDGNLCIYVTGSSNEFTTRGWGVSKCWPELPVAGIAQLDTLLKSTKLGAAQITVEGDPGWVIGLSVW